MAEISKLNLTGADLDIKDSVARGKLTVVDPTAGEGLITFGVDANGNYGYKKVGADTVTPFLTGGSGGDMSVLESKPSSSITGATSISGSMYAYNINAGNYKTISLDTPIAIKSGDIIILGLLTQSSTTPNVTIVNHDSDIDLITTTEIKGPGSPLSLAYRQYFYKALIDFTANTIRVGSTTSKNRIVCTTSSTAHLGCWIISNS